MKVIKRNGTEVEFDASKIKRAVSAANKERESVLLEDEVSLITDKVVNKCQVLNRQVSVEEIQDMVEEELMKFSYEVARAYIRYRYDREKVRNGSVLKSKILAIVDDKDEEAKQENSNKNPTLLPTQRDYMAGEISRDLTNDILDPDIVAAHKDGKIHFHDSDYFAQHMHNCSLINIEDMLQNGTVISGTAIDKPKTLSTAATILTQIIAQVASSQYGGQSISLAHIAPFVNDTRVKFRKDYAHYKEIMGEVAFNELIEQMVKTEINKSVQTIQYQLITLMTTNGQAPFVTIFMYIDEVPEGIVRDDLVLLIEEVLKQRIKGVKNEKGVWSTTAFPKLIYVLDEDNINPDSKYFWLTQLAAECTSKRMVPDYISAKKMKEYKQGYVYPVMGCRSALTVYHDENGNPKFYGRFNQGVVTVNLPYIALESGGDKEKFWKIFDERLELCHRALQARHERLEGTSSDVAPLLWQHGALARLGKGEKIDKLLHGGYSTLSLGYAGLYETTKYMTGSTHTKEPGKTFALQIMRALNDYTAKWKAAENIDYSLYGTPLESTTYKFAKALQNKFGKIPGVTDKNYVTNSYHVHVTEDINAFDKLAFESEFQKLSPGGAISYVEVPDMTGNINAVIAVMRFIYEHIMYAELNSKSDYCMKCGYQGEIRIVEDDSKLVWECPCCKNRDQRLMIVPRRTCGYIGMQFWNQGRTQEIRDRKLHL